MSLSKLEAYDAERAMALFAAGDYLSVKAMAEPFAAAGIGAAQCMIGLLYHLGLGVDRSAERTLFRLNQATANGDPIALNNLGTLYIGGMPGLEVDRELGLEYIRRSKAAGFGSMDVSDLE